MSILDRLPAARGLRWMLVPVALVLATLAIGFVLWWLLWRPQAAQRAAATATVQAEMAKGTAGAATDAVRIRTEIDRTRETIRTVTKENDLAIQAAAGAADPIGADLDRAGRAALCVRAAHRADPGCAAVQRAGDGIGPALPDIGSLTPP